MGKSKILARSLSVLALVGTLAALPSNAREGVEVGPISRAAGLVNASQIEQSAAQQYLQMAQQAKQQRALAPDNHPQVLRLRAIAKRIIPYSYEWNERAKGWQWEVNLLGSNQINAFCMPGGKIAFYSGILSQLQLNDDEVAMIMGHEIAHALREHARERVGKQQATGTGLSLLSRALGWGQLGEIGASMGTQLLSMRWGRDDESEADLVGLELAARAGYDPRAGVTLWQKMGAASGGSGPPQWLSTHPKGDNRISEIERALPIVLPLYERAAKPPVRYAPMAKAPLAAASAPQTPQNPQ